MRRRPSERRPVDLRKKVRPLGERTGNPSPATKPPVSELESPKLKMTGGRRVHWEKTREGGRRRRRRKVKRPTMAAIVTGQFKARKAAVFLLSLCLCEIYFVGF